MSRLQVLNDDNERWVSALNEFLLVAHNADGTLKLEEVDATTLGVVPEVGTEQVATQNVAVINQFFKDYPGPGSKLVLPAGTIFINGTINLLNHSGCVLRGRGMNATVLQQQAEVCTIKMAGFYNYIGDMMMVGPANASGRNEICGLYIKGWPQKDPDTLIPLISDDPTKLSPSKFNTFRNLFVQQFYTGIRVGHFSDLDEFSGDQQDPDIAANLWQNIMLEKNVYGLIRDGQNILNDHFENFFSSSAYRHHVFLPRGGDFRCFTAQFGSTLVSDDAPSRGLEAKIHSYAAGPIILINARSESNNGNNVPFLRAVHAQTFVEMHEVVVTNLAGTSNLDIDLQGGRATFVNCKVNGTIRLANTQYIGLNNEVGTYDRVNYPQHTIIFDAAVGTSAGFPNTPGLDMTDLTIHPYGVDLNSALTLKQRPLGDNNPQSHVVLKNEVGKAVLATEGLYGGAAGGVEIRIGGTTLFSIDGDGNIWAKGAKAAMVTAGDYGSRKLYAVESPQNWFEDLGSAQLVDGVATVTIDPVFAQTVNLDMPYHIFLTPLGSYPLFVSQKTAVSFTVRAVDSAKCDIAFDYRIVALRKGFEHMRLVSS